MGTMRRHTSAALTETTESTFDTTWFYLCEQVAEYNKQIDLRPTITEPEVMLLQAQYTLPIYRSCRALLTHEDFKDKKQKTKDEILASYLWWGAVVETLKDEGLIIYENN
jgi:hypothetical protein